MGWPTSSEVGNTNSTSPRLKPWGTQFAESRVTQLAGEIRTLDIKYDFE